MEFPKTGTQCSFKQCSLLDFLPVVCQNCQLTFCKDHSFPDAHTCTRKVDNVVSELKTSPNNVCSVEGCSVSDPVEMKCQSCQKHFCLLHRHHVCTLPSSSSTRRETQKALKEQFKRAKEATDETVRNKLKSTSNRELANKLKVMKLKGLSHGENQIPTEDRVYFCIAPPLQEREVSEGRGIFVDKNWTIGRAIDSIAKRMKIPNRNNVANEPKLRLFAMNGDLICSHTDVTIETLMSTGDLVNGDNLILEYISQWELDEGKIDVFSNTDALLRYKVM